MKETKRSSKSKSTSVDRDFAKGRQIYVGNIPFSVNKRQLEDLFGEFGELAKVEVPVDERNKSKGYGIVCFKAKEGAEEAIWAVDKAKFNERVVSVKLDEKI